MRKNIRFDHFYFGLLMISFCLFVVIPDSNETQKTGNSQEFLNYEIISAATVEGEPYNTSQLSNYSLSVKLHEEQNKVEGNLTVDYYNNDNVVFNSIPFHLYPSGMQYDERQGSIEILNVTTIDLPKIGLDYDVFSDIQLMWVNLTDSLQPTERVSFEISFNTTFADAGIDRCNSYGWDDNESRIYKFAAGYPMPSVYDNEDSWNIDPYLDVGDPFYSDMGWYNFIIEAPNEMVIAATGELVTKEVGEFTTVHTYDPESPVRELTFSSSRYFIVESKMVNGVNISVYYIPKSTSIWHDKALEYTETALILFNNSFGDYPYPTFNVVEEYTSFGGMEYPLQVYITEKADYKQYPDGYLESVIVHETAHQWFYQLIGNDEVDAGFIDEGLTSWALDYYLSIYHLDWGENGAFSQLNYIKNYYNDVGLPNKINQSVYESVESGSNYWYTAYSKTPIILEKLRETIGYDNFLNGLRLLFERFQFKNVWLSDVQDAFEDASEASLNWFFLPWFDNAYLPNYTFSDASYDTETGNLSLTIEDLNQENNEYEYSQKIPLFIYDESDLLIMDIDIWVNGTTSLNISVDEKPGKLELVYSSFVLAQVTSYDIDRISTENIPISNEDVGNGTIPGYPVGLLIFFTIAALGFGLFIIKNKFKRSWE